MWNIVVVTRRTEEDINQRPKRLFEKNNITLAILVYVPSRAMLKQDFLEVNNDVPKGLEVTLEPAIGNHDQEILDNWY